MFLQQELHRKMNYPSLVYTLKISRLLLNRFLASAVLLMSVLAVGTAVSEVVGVDVVAWAVLTLQNSFHRITLQVTTSPTFFW